MLERLFFENQDKIKPFCMNLKNLSIVAITFASFGFSSLSAQKQTPAPAKEANVKTDKPESLAMAVAKALKNKDEQAFLSLLPTKAELLKIVSKSTLKERSEIMSDPDAFMKRMTEGAKSSFKNMIAEGEANGITWSATAYQHCKPTYKTRDDIETGDLEIVLAAAGKSYTVTAGDLLKTDKGWKAGGRLSFGSAQMDQQLREQRSKAIMDSLNKVIDAERKSE